MIPRFIPAIARILFLTGLLLPLFSNVATAANPTIDLTEPEKQWLQAHPSIRLAVDIDWSPFEFVDEDGEYVGMAAEYIALVGQRLGIEFEVEKQKPWPEVVAAVKNRELDMFSCVVSTVQRREYVDFTQPYLSFPMVIVTTSQVAYVDGLKDLKNEAVAVVRGYATHDLLEKNHPELKLYLADNVADALEKLSNGKVYAYIGNIATVSHVIKRDGLTNIKISGQTPYKYELSMAVRNDWPEFVPILQKALDTISQQEQDHIHRNWIKLRYEHGFDYDLLWKVLAVVFLMVLIILFWNRRLSREVEKRTQAEKMLQEASLNLEQINKQQLDYIDIIDRYVITSSTDRYGNFVSASTAFCEISGYSEKELIGKNHGVVQREDIPDSTYQDLWETISRGDLWEGELRNKKKNGDYYWVQAYISPIFDENYEIDGYNIIREDITAKKRAEELSITDELTGLFNRRHFNKLYPRELSRACRENRSFGLMIADVDYFKSYNDNYGHQQGDLVLQQVSQLLQKSLKRASDFAFRIGGEEFAIIVTADSDEDILGFAEKLRQSVEDLRIEHNVSPVSTSVTVSIGVKIQQGRIAPSGSIDNIFRQADDALYEAKDLGRNQVVKYSSVVEVPIVKQN